MDLTSSAQRIKLPAGNLRRGATVTGATVGRLARLLAAASLIAVGCAPGLAEEFRSPSVSVVRVEWRAVLDQLHAELDAAPAAASNFSFASQRRVSSSDPRSIPALAQLNGVTSQIFNGIGRSPVPVLLPFDTASYLDARLNGTAPERSLPRYQADFRPVDLFEAGPAGYDAVFSLEPGAGSGDRKSTRL